jgi:hypothetical protein
MGFDKTCRFCNINGHAIDDCQLFINFLMASRFAKQNADLVTSTLKKHSTFMRLKPCGRAPHVNNIDTMTSLDVPVTDGVTLDGGQIVQLDDDGLIYHIQDDSALYDYKGSDNESVHLDPFTTPVINITDMDRSFIPDIGDYLVAHVGEEQDYLFTYDDAVAEATTDEEENYRSTPTLPPSST